MNGYILITNVETNLVSPTMFLRSSFEVPSKFLRSSFEVPSKFFEESSSSLGWKKTAILANPAETFWRFELSRNPLIFLNTTESFWIFLFIRRIKDGLNKSEAPFYSSLRLRFGIENDCVCLHLVSFAGSSLKISINVYPFQSFVRVLSVPLFLHGLLYTEKCQVNYSLVWRLSHWIP